MNSMQHGAEASMPMSGLYSQSSMTREVSGTSWQPNERTFAIKKLTLGGICDFYNDYHLVLGIGALASRYEKPSILDDNYGSEPKSLMVFLRAKLK